jgi:hypothetical protein
MPTIHISVAVVVLSIRMFGEADTWLNNLIE